ALLGLFDQFPTLFGFVDGIGDRFDLHLPGDLPVVVFRWVHCYGGNVLEIGACLVVHFVVHGDDSCRIGGGDLFDDVGSEPVGGVIDGGRFGIVEFVPRPRADSGRVGVPFRAPGGDCDRRDSQGQQRVRVTQAESGDAWFVGRRLFRFVLRIAT